MNIKNILYTIDLDSNNVSPVIKALEIANYFNSRLHIFYVNDTEAGYRHPTSREDDVALKVAELASHDLLESTNIIYSVSKGDLSKEIVKYCADNKIELIITGHKHRNKFYSIFFDSPDENIIDAINIPVLVIPKK